ncbi:MAG: response regulator transcription factor [Chloroflexota bacterium]|nr:response regulator transcription factor [Chloroflexota bacterium]
MFLNDAVGSNRTSWMAMDKTIRVMVVDDREEVRESMETLLSLQDDMEVVGEAGDGLQAVEIARQLRPDVIVMDVAMSNQCSIPFDGLDACQQIRREGLDAAVIVMTVYGDRATRQRAQQAGCSLFLEKGVSPTELINQVRCLGHYHQPC